MAVRPTQLGAKFVGFMDPDFQLVVIPRWLYDGVRADAVSTERDRLEAEIIPLLDGIDRGEDGGWWETSSGVKFGTETLAKIKNAIRARGQ